MIKWRFENINLPDSASNEPASHGFIQFSVKAKPLVSPGDSILNRVGIYFDFNPVVLTNFARTVFYLPVSATSEAAAGGRLQVFPNPFGEQFWVEMPTHSDAQALPSLSDIRHLEISDPTGRLLRRQYFTG